ncbi:MAG: PhzF family phenazine biosynthesis protein [Halococcoides sp.]
MNDHRAISILDVFTRDPFAGTPTAVLDASGLSTAQLRSIADELGVTVAGVEEAGRAVTVEGQRPSVAAIIAASAAGQVDDTVESAGQSYAVTHEDRTWIGGFEPSVRSVAADEERIAGALGIETVALAGVGEDLPVARASIGRPVLAVPVNYFEQVSDLDPAPGAIEECCVSFDAEIVAVYTFDTLDRDATVHCRAFETTGGGIDERPASGRIGGAIGAILRRFGGIDASEVVCEQGEFLDRPGRIAVRTDGDMAIGGHHASALTGEIVVPDDDSDDLIVI